MRHERLERALDEAGLTRVQLAEACGVGAKTVERWITQGRPPRLRHQYKVAEMVDVPARELWPDPTHDPELVELFPERAAIPRETWLDLLDGLAEGLDVLVYAGLFFHEQHPRLIPLLRDKADGGVKVRLLFGDPEADAVARRGHEEGIGDTVPAKVRNALAVYRLLVGHPDIEVRLHSTTLYASIYRFDEQMVVNPHIHGLPAAQSPALHLHRSPTGHLFAAYSDCFERIWADATPAWEL